MAGQSVGREGASFAELLCRCAVVCERLDGPRDGSVTTGELKLQRFYTISEVAADLDSLNVSAARDDDRMPASLR